LWCGLEGFQRNPSTLLYASDPGTITINPVYDAFNSFAAQQGHFDVVAGLGKRHDTSEASIGSTLIKP